MPALPGEVLLLRSRSRHTLWFGLAVFTIFVFGDPVLANHSTVERLFDAFGDLLIVAGGSIRVYSTLFIGGWKNQRLTASGPYAMVRNPLYLGSLVITVGVGLDTATLTITVLLFAFLLFYYSRTVAREEQFLIQQFGEEYLEYMRAVPRWLPRPGMRLVSPLEVPAKPRYLLNVIRDFMLVVMVGPLCELVRAGHESGLLPIAYRLW